MPRDGSGTFTAPAGTTATSGTTIESAKYNAFVNDLVTDANTARPIVAGGTGATTAGAALTALGAQPLDAGLTSIAGLTTAADRMIYTTASDVYEVATLTAAGRALLDDADAAAQLVTLGAQAADADLTALAALSTTGIVARTAANTYVPRTITSTDASVTITNPGGVAGDIDLSASPGVASGPTSTTSGANVDMSGITGAPKRIFLRLDDCSCSVAGNPGFQFIVAGSPVASGYTADGSFTDNANLATATSTTGFVLNSNAGVAAQWSGLWEFRRIPGTQRWIGVFRGTHNSARSLCWGNGAITLSGNPEGIRLVASTAWDAGAVTMWWEF